jgi:2-methylcitrate dehydratase PrpD
MPARNGVTAALLVRAGWNGVDDVFSGDDNFFAVNAPKSTAAVLIERLGERFEIANTDIKKWTVGTRFRRRSTRSPTCGPGILSRRIR